MSDIAALTGQWDHALLPPNVQVGTGVFMERLESFARFRSERDPGLVLGDRVIVHTWSAFSVEPAGRIDVGADSLLVGAVFMCAEQITLGERVLISYNVTIADSDFHPIDAQARRRDAVANSPFASAATRPPFVARPVIIEDDVWVGIGAIILKGVRIGRGARIGPGAVVTSDVPPGTTMVGNPAVPAG